MDPPPRLPTAPKSWTELVDIIDDLTLDVHVREAAMHELSRRRNELADGSSSHNSNDGKTEDKGEMDTEGKGDKQGKGQLTDDMISESDTKGKS